MCGWSASPVLSCVQPKFERRWDPPLTEQDRRLPWWHERFKVKHLDDYELKEEGYEGDTDEPLLQEDLEIDLEGPLARQLAVSTHAWACQPLAHLISNPPFAQHAAHPLAALARHSGSCVGPHGAALAVRLRAVAGRS